jgi:hypothetical protein
MNAGIAWIALQSLVSLSIILWLLFWGLPAYRLERYRQALFDVRDRLFDYAAEGSIAFEDPAYGMLRSTINGFIRFAHRISFSHVVLMIILNSPRLAQAGHSFAHRWARNTEGLPNGAKQQLDAFLWEVNIHTARYALGYLADLLLTIMKSIDVAASFGGRIKRFLLEVRDNVDAAALIYAGEDAPTSSTAQVQVGGAGS